jgi:hypothetical protein
MKITKRLILVILILIINSLLLQKKIKKIKEKYSVQKVEQELKYLKTFLQKNIDEKITPEKNTANNSYSNTVNNFNKKTKVLENKKNIVNSIGNINTYKSQKNNYQTQKSQLNNFINGQEFLKRHQQSQINTLNTNILDYFEPNIYELNNLTNKKKFHLMDASNNNYIILKKFDGIPILSSINNINKISNKEKLIFQLFKDDTNLDYMYDPKNIPISNYSYNDNYVLSNEKQGYLRLDNNYTLFSLYEKGLRLKLIPVDNSSDNLSINNGDKFKIAHIQKNNDKFSKKFITYNDNLNQYVFSDENLNPSVFKFEFINN